MNIKRLLLMRSSARVTRCHTMPTIYKQSDGEHTYGVLAIILSIWESPSIDLLKAALYHDSPECLIGDTPAPAKWRHYDLAVALDKAEDSIAKEFGLITESSLNLFEAKVLKYADVMEFAMFACEEIDMGNQSMREQFFNAMAAFKRLGLIDITPEAQQLYDYVKTRGELLYARACSAVEQPFNSWPEY